MIKKISRGNTYFDYVVINFKSPVFRFKIESSLTVFSQLQYSYTFGVPSTN